MVSFIQGLPHQENIKNLMPNIASWVPTPLQRINPFSDFLAEKPLAYRKTVVIAIGIEVLFSFYIYTRKNLKHEEQLIITAISLSLLLSAVMISKTLETSH